MTGLAPTATALAGYFCISDLILITQCVYYNVRNARKARRRRHSSVAVPSEDQPLLRQNSTHPREDDGNPDALKRVAAGEGEPTNSSWLNNALAILGIHVVGAMGWFISYRIGAWDRSDGADAPDPSSPVGMTGLVLGYASAICYLWYVNADECIT